MQRISPWLAGARPLAVTRVSVSLITLILGACAVTPNVKSTGEAVPREAPRVTGLKNAVEREHVRLVTAFGGSYNAPAAQRMLEELVARLVPATDSPNQNYRVTILDSPLVNAFALPTGNIYVTRGLLALANDASELGGVMAHEMAHVTASHAMARDELEKRTDLISRVNAHVLNDPAGGEAFRANAQGTIAGFSREQELEADRIGIRTSARAGYDPYGSARFLEALDRSVRFGKSGNGQSANAANFLATHPSTPQRIALALRAAREVSAPGVGERDRNAYLAAIDGITWGDDPMNGEVRGRVFRHPRLGITFTAPQGFTLDNSNQAVLGVSRGGELALRLDAVELAPSEALDTFLSSGWIDGVSTESTALTTVNGQPAATGVARGNNWIFYLGAVRFDTTVFRLVIATRQRDAQVERDFQMALESVRKMSPAEIRAIKPLRIRIVTATDSDTSETLAERMALTSMALERFRVLNGLRPGEKLVAGQRYKVVAE
ncbi:M48 family metalloprotease [Pseudochelatococcus sp. G4_1912]|uniref:M48 family metalloprotease n=1 Tax=Pseudochelatococcus sp. G4_1912 TaxID=3114288 RepID=UPI0039C63C1C